MNDTLLPRIGGVSALAATLAQFAAIAIGASNGGGPGVIDFGSGEQIEALLPNHAGLILGLSFATLSPCLSAPMWMGLYYIVRRTGSLALFGTVMLYAFFSYGILRDVIRLAVFLKLPPAYAAAPENGKPALLALGSTLGFAQELLAFVTWTGAVGIGLLAMSLAILKSPELPRWLGWLGLTASILLGWIGAPAAFFAAGAPLAGALMGVGILAFVAFATSAGIVMLGWRPA